MPRFVAAASFIVLAPAWAVSAVHHGPASWVSEMVSIGFVTATTIATILMWRRPGGRAPGLAVAASLAFATQAFLVTLITLNTRPASDALALAATSAMGLAGLACVVGAVTDRVATRSHDDSCAIALGLGLVAQASLVLEIPVEATGTAGRALLGVIMSAPALAVVLLVARRVLPQQLSLILAATAAVTLASVALDVFRPADTGWILVVAVARAAAGAAWLGAGWSFLRRLLDEDRRRTAEVERALAATREHREQLHELRSTVAGLVNGSEMLGYPHISAAERRHLWVAVRRELDRLQRMLSSDEPAATDLDLDDALQTIIDLQRLKGRHVELHGSGGTVRARFDWLAEVVNILMDNAAVHGGSDSSRVEVSTGADGTVDISITDFGRGIPAAERERIFDWGARASDSPGEGIGLNLAQRLVARDGGALRLAERTEPGSTFVISLPAQRRPVQDQLGLGR